MPIPTPLLRLGVALLLGGAVALSAGPLDPHGTAGIDFARFAGGDVPWLRYTQLEGWDHLGGTRLALRTSATHAFLVEVAPPCTPLAEVRTLGITALRSRVEVGRDEVIADGRRCTVQRIAPLDLAALAAIRATPAMQRLVVVRPRSLDRGPLTRPPDD